MEGQSVVTSDDHKVGTVVAERDGCVVVESGHVFKSKHAIPTEFLHEHDGELRATVGKDVVHDSPKVDGETFDVNAVKAHYGLLDVHTSEPEPDLPVDPETTGLDPADSASFGGHPRTHVGVNDRSAKPGER